MKRAVLVLAVCGVVFAFGTSAFSAEVTSTLDVSATVLEVCTVSTVPVNFGDFNGATTIYSGGSVNITCTDGVAYEIAMDGGLHKELGDNDRRMSGGIYWLEYELFQDSSLTTCWGDDSYYRSHPCMEKTGTGTGLEQQHTVYGELSGSQIVPADTYTDVVNVTVYY